MKNIFYILIAFTFFFISCKKEELFPYLDKRINNDGYLPLAQDNFWQYENYKTIKKAGDKYVYTDDSDDKKRTDQFITNTIQYTGKANPGARFDYKLSPIDVGSFLGTFIGLFNQVSKSNGEYRTKQIFRFRNADFNGSEKNSLTFELDEQPFLTDEPVAGKILSETEGNLDSPDGAIKIQYKKITKIVGVIPQLPDELSNIAGIDDQLKNFKDIVHIVDSILIKKIIITEKAGNTIVLDAKVNLLPGTPGEPGGRTTFNINEDGTKLNSKINFPYLGVQIGTLRGDNMTIKTGKLIQTSCLMEAPIKINTTLIGGEINLIPTINPNNPAAFMSVDSYWAKGVGKIKSVTKSYSFPISFNITDYIKTDTFRIDLKRVDPKCGGIDQPSTTALEVSLQLQTPDPIGIELPIGESDYIYVQNLVDYGIRKSLN